MMRFDNGYSEYHKSYLEFKDASVNVRFIHFGYDYQYFKNRDVLYEIFRCCIFWFLVMIRETEIYSCLSTSLLICVLWLCCCSTTFWIHQSEHGSFLWAIWHVILYYFLDNVEIDLKSLEWHHWSCLIQFSVNFNAYKDLRHLILWCWFSHDVWLWRVLRTHPCFAGMPQVANVAVDGVWGR
jgi:hypothetical protein